MNKAKLIKKSAHAEQKPGSTVAPPTHTPRQVLANAQKTVTQWLIARQHSQSQNPRAAFEALFATEM